MLSTLLRNIPLSSLKILLEKCELPSSLENIKKEFNISVQFSKNEKNEIFATINTQYQDSIWWSENKHKKLNNWRESDSSIYCFTDYSDSLERSLYIVLLRVIKPNTCLKYLSE